MSRHKRMSITRGVFCAFLLLLSIYSINLFYSYRSLHVVAELTETIYLHPLVVSNAANQVCANIIKAHARLHDMATAEDPQRRPALEKELRELDQQITSDLHLIAGQILGEEGKKLAEEARRLYSGCTRLQGEVLKSLGAGEQREAVQTAIDESDQLAARLDVQMRQVSAYARNKATGFMQKVQEESRLEGIRSVYFFIGWLVFSICIVAVVVTRSRFLEKEVVEQRDYLDVTLKAIGDGVIATDYQDNITLINDVAAELTGCREPDVTGEPLGDVLILEDGQSGRPFGGDEFRQLLARDRATLPGDIVLAAKNGVKRYIGGGSTAIFASGSRERIGTVVVFRDRSQIRADQEKLMESERRYRLLSDNTLDVIWMMDLALQFRYVNQAVTQMMGYTVDEWLGSHLYDYCSPDSLDEMKEMVVAELAKGKSGEGVLFETAMRHKNGTMVPLEIRGKLLFDDENQPMFLQGVTRDITKRKRVEAKLCRSEGLLNAAQKLGHIGGWEWDADRRELFWTEESYLLHGLAPDPLNDPKNLHQRRRSCYSAEDNDRIDELFAKCVTEGERYEMECWLTSITGNRSWVRMEGEAVFENGVIVRVRGNIQDITARKQSEDAIRHLNRVLRTIRHVNQLVVRERNPEKLVQAACSLLVDDHGYNCAHIYLQDEDGKLVFSAHADQTNQLPAQLHPPRLLAGMASWLEKSHAAAGDVIVARDCPVCEICPRSSGAGAMQTLLCRLSHDGQGYGYLLAALSQDVLIDDEEESLFEEMAGDIGYALHGIEMEAERKRLEKRRESLEAQLAHAQKLESIGRLAGGVAHDFNNMLGVIIGFSEIALEKISPREELYSDLSEIHSAAMRSADITRQLLAFARLQTIAPKTLNLNDIISQMLKMLGRLIGENVKIVWLPGSDLGLIRIDPSQIDQILANLCVNASDAIDGTGTITIETANITFREEDSFVHSEYQFIPGDYVVLAVSDDGIGMDDVTLQRIFEPFFTTKKPGQGTGLGMATVYGIVKQNKGFINVYSELGKGTTVRIYLPRSGLDPAGTIGAEERKLLHGSGETVLIVEDEPAILRLAVKMLGRLGYDILEASGPEEAVKAAGNYDETIDLLITDVIMPGMDGRKLSRLLTAKRPSLRTLFMSGYTANVIVHQGVLDQDVNFIQKPFSLEELALKVQAALSHSC